MCGRYILAQKIEIIEERFNIKAPDDFYFEPDFNISPGKFVPVISSENPRQLTLYRFGMTPFWSKKPFMIINARAEGDRNAENDPHYHGAKEIINKSSFRKPIRSQRCLVIADAFIEGTTSEKLDKPFLVYLRDKNRPFAMAGIWDEWVNTQTGEIVKSFAIVTTVANELLQKIPHHRSPVILPRKYEAAWLNPETPLTDITRLLRPYDSDLMNAYPIGKEIKSPKANGRHLIEPVGKPIMSGENFKVTDYLKKQGMGYSKIRFTDPEGQS